MTFSVLIGLIASAAAILGTVFAAFFWLFKLASEVAVLKSQMGQINPVKIATDLAWIKGGVAILANALHVRIEDEA